MLNQYPREMQRLGRMIHALDEYEKEEVEKENKRGANR